MNSNSGIGISAMRSSAVSASSHIFNKLIF
eukprot:SAG22_NODE_1529_length_4218_cov_2.153435_2_plen_30_part_00